MSWPRTRGSRPLVLGHRGARGGATENTVAAFRRAIEDGADGIELDARVCASGEVVVFHDDTLERLAGRDQRVDELTWSQLRAVSFADGERIPLLSEVLQAVPGWVNVEIKPPPWQGLAAWSRAVARVIDESGAVARVLVTSFHPGVVAWFRLRRPHIDAGLLFHAGQGPLSRRGLPARLLRPAAVHPEHVLLREGNVRAWRARGLAIGAWTVDDPVRARRLAQFGVTAIISNDPGPIVRALEQRGQ